ncbi:glycosyltransferase [Thiorhodococcus minor]|uniref:Glycosyltransferase family 4 protein n=1 Tax=Thiorhodococcus minor TaxID=57489 RepID=A0A6M0K5K1_9GAMM|nr:glycosyltransferase [Thiorhodococcus minor]NEV65056.1 glycosyltransferase family 4 protein [Thiorhodococcus minor]
MTLFFPKTFVCDDLTDDSCSVLHPPKWISAVPAPSFYNPFLLAFLVYHVVARHYDVVHVCPGHRPLYLIPAAFSKIIHRSILVDEWWEWFGKEGLGANTQGTLRKFLAWLEDWLELRSKRFYDIIFPITNTLKERLPKDLQARASVLRGGIDDELKMYEKASARRSLALSEDDIIVGMCGLCDADHQDNAPFIDAFIRTLSTVPQLKLMASGDNDYIKNVIRQLVPKANLIDVGWQPYNQYNVFMSACDVFALPLSDSPRNKGRWPNKLGDFIALRRPIMTCPVGDIPELFETNQAFGWCVPNERAAYEMALEELSANPGKAIHVANYVPLPPGAFLTTGERSDLILESYRSARDGRR